MRFLTTDTREPTSLEQLVALGADRLAQLVLDGAASDPGLLENVRRTMTKRQRAAPTVAASASAGSDEPHMVGSDPAMQLVYDTIRKIAVTSAPVLRLTS